MKTTIKQFITIVTPTYNRENLLPSLYRSLCQQSNLDFIWLIIDDGSTDDTTSIVKSFFSENKIIIQYIKKANGGKHTALNIAIKLVQTELFFIVDSDDKLTSDAIDTIYSDWNLIKEKDLCGISYLRGHSIKEHIGDAFPEDHVIDNFIQLRFNKGIDGDKAEVWTTRSLAGLQFPEYPGERFISESYLWIKLAKKQDMLFVNRIIYLTEYLEGGLSRTGRKLRFQCPRGMIDGSLETMSSEFSLKIQFKETLLYIVYSLFAKRSIRTMLFCPYPFKTLICMLPGWLLYKYWQNKYMK